MKKLRIHTALSIFLVLLSAESFSQADQGLTDKVTGLYWSPKKDAKIEIYKKGDLYFGKSVWVATPAKDIKNPEKALQTREVPGIELLSCFSFKDGIYSGGTIYDPESGKTYDCKMNLIGNILKVRGYIGISLFGRTENFERIK
jgi:uncharacterized protein (DUF2147 family)